MDAAKAIRIHRCQHPKNPEKLIAVYSGEAIHVVRKGKAGHINYLATDDYTLNDDAYLVVDKKTHKYKVSWKWLAVFHPHVFREYASNSDNGTWNMTGFLEHATFDIPSYKEQQTAIRQAETTIEH